MRGADRERGSITAIEVLGVIPIAAIVVGAIFQLYLLGQAGVEAESAARLAARELSKGASESVARQAGRGQANARFDVRIDVGATDAGEPGGVGTAGDSVAVTASATVPFLGIGVDGLDLTIERSAVMPADHAGLY